ncbi:MAG: DUF3606 domain-containing protein [Pedobacter sp.]|nr:MAG: DUF3606 domain-containing protein [Pedobacter sp.]
MITSTYNFQSNEMIAIAEEQDLNYWSKIFNVSAEKLKTAVRATRSLDCELIKNYLKKFETK